MGGNPGRPWEEWGAIEWCDAGRLKDLTYDLRNYHGCCLGDDLESSWEERADPDRRLWEFGGEPAVTGPVAVGMEREGPRAALEAGTPGPWCYRVR